MPRAAVFLFVIAIAGLLLAFLGRPTDVAPSPSATAGSSPTRPAATATPDPLTGVPADCRADVHGTAFTTGSIDQRASAAQQWMDAHRGQQASVIVTEDLVNEAAVRESRSQPVRDLRITIEPAGFRLSASAIVLIGSFPIKALLVPSASGGALRIDVRDLDTDGLPGFFRGSVQDSLQRAADPTAWGIKMRVLGVATRNGCAVIWGTA